MWECTNLNPYLYSATLPQQKRDQTNGIQWEEEEEGEEADEEGMGLYLGQGGFSWVGCYAHSFVHT